MRNGTSPDGRPARVVAVGHGYWGKNITRNLHELGALHGVCEPDDAERERVHALYPGLNRYASYCDVLTDPEVEAVALATPAESHAPLAIHAMEAGLDVFVEKPLALTFSEGHRMAAKSDETGRMLMVGHLLEYHPGVVKLAEMVHGGELGRLQYVYSNRLNLGKFRRQENILWSFAPHDIAVILRLARQEPIEVVATGGAYLQANVADITTTNLLFDNGVRAHIFVSWLHPYKEQRLVVIGSGKMAVFDDTACNGNKLMLYDQGADWVDNRLVPRRGDGVPVPFDQGEPLKEEMRHFLYCIRTRETPRTDARTGADVLRVLQAAQHSLQMGGSRVPLAQAYSRMEVL